MNEYPIRFGILGCGSAASYHAAAIGANEGAELACVCGGTRAAAFAGERGVPVAESYEAMLADGSIHAVSLCTPSGFHAQQALAALAAGKHLVIEKPLAIRNEDADRVLEAAEKAGRTVTVISQFRFSDAAQALHRAVSSGAFGTIVSASLTMRYFRDQAYYDSGAWRGTRDIDGGGILMNQGIHGIDLFAYLMGPAVQVTGYTATRLRHIEVEDTACAAVTFANGALGIIDATVCNPGGSPMRIEICGERGAAVLEDESITRWTLDSPCPCPVGAPSESSSSASPTGISAENHTRQYRDFLAAIRHGTEPLVGVRDGRHALQIIRGVYTSARTGRPAALSY